MGSNILWRQSLTQTFKPQPGKQEAFLSTPADIAIYGGMAFGGKTYALLLDPIRGLGVEGWGAVIFRKNSTQVTAEGGLSDTSKEIYPFAGGEYIESRLQWKFRNEAIENKISFRHLEYDKTVYDWQGAQIPAIYFDELTHFSKKQFFYMLSRNRSRFPGITAYMRATCNPDSESWVREFIDWWIGDDGFAIEERSGVLRWLYVINDKYHWYASRKEAEKAHPDLAEIDAPKSVTFIPASIDDNPIGLKKNPGYKGSLLAMAMVERERLLKGNWNVRAEAGKVYNRDWFKFVKEAPLEGREAMGWDKAGTEGGGKRTAGVHTRKIGDDFYILNCIVGQWSALKREEIIRQAARDNGPACVNVIEQEPGSGGKESAENTERSLKGYKTVIVKVSTDKEERAMPMSALAESGHIYLVEGEWNKDYIEEYHNFPDGKFSDRVDGGTLAVNYLNRPLQRLTW